MGTIRLFKVGLVIGLMVLSGGSISYAQNTFPDDGNVGIGTTSPTVKLQVFGGSGNLIRLQSSTGMGTAGDGIGIAFGQSGDAEVSRIESAVESSSNIGLRFYTYSGSLGESVRITGSGNVGIGTASPTSKLHVSGAAKVTGDVTVDGNIAAKYQDVAEWVPTSASLPPGTVVVIDPIKNNRVLPAARYFIRRRRHGQSEGGPQRAGQS